MHHEHDSEKSYRQHDVHEGSGEGNNHSLPARLGEEGAGVVGIFVTRLLASHFHVAAEEDGAKAEIRLTLLEAEQPRAEAKAEGVHTHIEKASGPVMAQFVDENHHPDEDQEPPDIVKKIHMNLHRGTGIQRTRPFHYLPRGFSRLTIDL